MSGWFRRTAVATLAVGCLAAVAPGGASAATHRAGCRPGAVDGHGAPVCGALLSGFRDRPSNWTAANGALESYEGRPLDALHNYTNRSRGQGLWNGAEQNYYQQGRLLTLNYRPCGTSFTGCDNATAKGQVAADAEQTRTLAAANGNRPVLVSIFGEPERYTSGSGGKPGNAGSAAQFVAMYRLIVDTFRAHKVTNVRWVWTVQNCCGARRDLLAKEWPGNGYVDWVGWDPYDAWSGKAGRDKPTATIIQEGYDWLHGHSARDHDWNDRPWALMEWGIGFTKAEPARAFGADLDSMTTALNSCAMPKLKMLAYWDSGNNQLTGDATVRNAYRRFAGSDYLRQKKAC